MHAYALLLVTQALHPTEKKRYTNVQLHNNNTNILLQWFYILFNYSVNTTTTNNNNTITTITAITAITTNVQLLNVQLLQTADVDACI